MSDKKKVLMVIANNGFQDHEYGKTFQIFQEAWLDITVAAENKWICVWVFWIKTTAEKELFLVKPTKYDMTVFIWWWWAYTQYFHDKNYLKIASESTKIWAICVAPMIVSESWIFNGKTVTWWDQWWVQRTFIEKHWWIWSDENVVVCGNIVTWNWPDVAELFAKKCLEIINN